MAMGKTDLLKEHQKIIADGGIPDFKLSDKYKALARNFQAFATEENIVDLITNEHWTAEQMENEFNRLKKLLDDRFNYERDKYLAEYVTKQMDELLKKIR